MKKSINPDSSPANLERIVRVEPLSDVSLIIVHVNESFGSVRCCKEPLKRLLGERIASHVYEHVDSKKSFLQEYYEIKPLRNGSRYSDIVQNEGIFYRMIFNEKKDETYVIKGMKGNRFIIVGGQIGTCHFATTEAIAKELYSMPGIHEVHLPIDSIYEDGESYEGGDTEKAATIVHDIRKLAPYKQILSGKSYFLSLDEDVIGSFSIYQPTIHMAFWSSMDNMLNYLRKEERLVIKGTK